MAGQTVTHVLLDFFGTLVRYSPSRTEQGYHALRVQVIAIGRSPAELPRPLDIAFAATPRVRRLRWPGGAPRLAPTGC
jgi:hypothetical protein